jgi:undecaprenyl-diphosphatase
VRSLPGLDFSDTEARLAYLVLVGTLPAALIGFFFEDFSPHRFAPLGWWSSTGCSWGCVPGSGERQPQEFFLAVHKAELLWTLGVGLAQASALVPGVSRSGTTITCGLFLGLKREEAARFSFLLSVPVTAAAAGLSLAEAEPAGEGMDAHEAAMFLAGSVSSAVVGYVAIKFLLGFLVNHTLRVFAYYRFALAAVVTVVLLTSGS